MYVTLHMYATLNRPEVFFIMQDTDDLEALKYQNLTGDESTKCRRFENKPASSDDGQVAMATAATAASLPRNATTSADATTEELATQRSWRWQEAQRSTLMVPL